MEQNKPVNKMTDKAKKQYILEKIQSTSDSKTMFKIVDGLLKNPVQWSVAAYDWVKILCNSFAVYFQDKVAK